MDAAAPRAPSRAGGRPVAADAPAVDWPCPFPGGVVFRQAGPEVLAGPAPATLLPAERGLLGPAAAPRRLREFTLGRAAARAALAALLPERAAALAAGPIGRADARRPQWPAGVVGAITHHRGRAAAAVARSADFRGVGLDLESLRAPSPALQRRILRPEERAAWEALPPDAQAGAFMAVFSAKESLFKALYPHTGVYLGFQDARIELAAPAAVVGSAQGAQADGAAAGAGAGAGRAAQRTPLRWQVLRDCGADVPAGFAGEGCALAAAGLVLTAVWVPRG